MYFVAVTVHTRLTFDSYCCKPKYLFAFFKKRRSRFLRYIAQGELGCSLCGEKGNKKPVKTIQLFLCYLIQ